MVLEGTVTVRVHYSLANTPARLKVSVAIPVAGRTYDRMMYPVLTA